MSSRKAKLGDFLIRSKIPVDIEDNNQYKRVTIRTKHLGVSVRDVETGSKIGTKKQFVLKAGQFVLSKIDAMYGAFGIAPDEVDGAIITGNFWAYDYDKKMVSIEWLNHFTNSPDFYDLCRRASTGITHRKYLDEDFFLGYEVNLPDLNEQENLVVSIDAIRDKVISLENELTYQHTHLDNLNQAILQEAVQGKLVQQDPKDEPASELLKRIKAEKAKSGKKEKTLPPIKPEEIPFEIPESWVWCRLGEITDIQRGSSPRPKGDPRYFSKSTTKYNWITISDISNFCENNVLLQTREFLTEEGSKHSRYVYANEFIIAVSGSTTGKCCITGIEGFIYDGLAVAKIIENSFDSRYLLNYMMCLYTTINNSKTGASFPNINTDYLNNLIFPLPPIKEQIRINKELEGQFAKTEQLKKQIIANKKATEQLLKALLHQAFEVK